MQLDSALHTAATKAATTAASAITTMAERAAVEMELARRGAVAAYLAHIHDELKKMAARYPDIPLQDVKVCQRNATPAQKAALLTAGYNIVGECADRSERADRTSFFVSVPESAAADALARLPAATHERQ